MLFTPPSPCFCSFHLLFCAIQNSALPISPFKFSLPALPEICRHLSTERKKLPVISHIAEKRMYLLSGASWIILMVQTVEELWEHEYIFVCCVGADTAGLEWLIKITSILKCASMYTKMWAPGRQRPFSSHNPPRASHLGQIFWNLLMSLQESAVVWIVGCFVCVLLPMCSLWHSFSLTLIVNLIPGVSRLPAWLSCLKKPPSFQLVFVGPWMLPCMCSL